MTSSICHGEWHLICPFNVTWHLSVMSEICVLDSHFRGNDGVQSFRTDRFVILRRLNQTFNAKTNLSDMPETQKTGFRRRNDESQVVLCFWFSVFVENNGILASWVFAGKNRSRSAVIPAQAGDLDICVGYACFGWCNIKFLIPLSWGMTGCMVD